jgi:hypothetical protein
MWLLVYFFYKIGTQQLQNTQKIVATQQALFKTQSEAYRLQFGTENLGSIFQMIDQSIHKNTKQARQQITALSDLLRNALDYEKQDFVPLNQEIHLISKYLEIAQMGFQNTPIFQVAEELSKEDIKLSHNSLLILFVFAFENSTDTPQKLIRLQKGEDCQLRIWFESEIDVENLFAQSPIIQNLQQRLQATQRSLTFQKIKAHTFQIILPFFTDSSIL